MSEYFLIPEEHEIRFRLDSFLAERLEEYSRNGLQKWIGNGLVTVNGKPEKSNYRLRKGDEVAVLVPEPVALSLTPEPLKLDILYEDDHVIVLNKPQGMVVHPAAGHDSGTLVHGLLYHCGGQLSGINGVMRPGIVHRIDKDTSGVLVAAKTNLAHQGLSKQLAVHSMTRKYYAVVLNHVRDDAGAVRKPIGRHPVDRKKMAVTEKNSRPAVTHYRVLERFSPANMTYIEAALETGRTHQIRVHMASIGHPLLGDAVYGRGESRWHLNGQVLHAKCLGFVHPVTGETMEFEAPLPEYFQRLLDLLQ